MSQPVGNCPGCGADEPFEQIHTGACPDARGECLESACPEWACTACGAAVFMGIVPGGSEVAGASGCAPAADASVRAA